MIDRKAFFDAVRTVPFGGSLTTQQVQGCEAILAEWERRNPAGEGDPRWLAYALATTFHETARTMQPIIEHGGASYFRSRYDIEGARPDIARRLGNTQPGDGARFAGRGYVQLTGRSNYARAGRKLNIDLIGQPDLALKPDVAAVILFDGMIEGWFTGKALKDYFDAATDDALNARRIINGTDKADLIAGYHRVFLAALRAGWQAGAVLVPRPAPAPSSAPQPAAVVDLARAGGISAALARILAGDRAAWADIARIAEEARP
jgi:putative chitinase